MSPSFTEFFAAGNGGRSPFPWQVRLAERLVAGDTPAWVTVPTGLGKTAMIDCWAYALARSIEASRTSRVVPTRLIFVVNRRGIVDDATRRGQALVHALGGGDAAMVWARQLLLSAGHDLDVPLAVVRMRGGVSWDWLWLRQPDQPAVVTSTIDQFGSRLLFRGYGVAARLHPVDTALVANDAFVVLDEAHLSQPLVETIESVQAMQSQAPSPLFAARPLRFTRMTATPQSRADDAGEAVGVDERDGDDVVAGRRLRARKLIRPYAVSSDKRSADDAVAAVAVTAAVELLARVRSASPAALLIANTVSMARRVFAQVPPSFDKELLVGTSRSLERERVEAASRRRIGSGRDRSLPSTPFVLVSTQTVEVGADIDADVLVTEACSLDALIQRLGRLDRLGERTALDGGAEGVVLFSSHRHADPSSPSYGIYQHAAAEVSALLEEWVGHEVATTSAKGAFDLSATSIDLGPLALNDRLSSGVQMSALLPAFVHAPVLLPTAVRAWAQTSPIPVPDRSVVPYLHGPGRGDAELDLCWRDLGGDAPLDGPIVSSLTDVLIALVPLSEEMVTVRRWEALRFLLEHESRSPVTPEPGDVAGGPAVDGAQARNARVRFATRVDAEWKLFDRGDLVAPSQLAGTGVVVVDSSAGGHDGWAWNPTSGTPVVDIGDLVGAVETRPIVISRRRLQMLGYGEEVVSALDTLIDGVTIDDQAARVGLESLNAACGLFAIDDVDRSPRARFGQRLAARLAQGWTLARIDEPHDAEIGDDDPPSTLLLVSAPIRGSRRVDPASLTVSDDSDDATSRTAFDSVLLHTHLRDVGDRCMLMADRLGLDGRLAELCARAARVHDLGKADRRFQALLRDGDWLTAEIEDGGGDLLAKSTPGHRQQQHGLPSERQWPRGLRHEAVSMRMLTDTPGWDCDLDDAERELLVHLVGAHHGFNRPLFTPVRDDDPVRAQFAIDDVKYSTEGSTTSIDWSQPRRFAELNRRYSPWGLAYLEALVRFADFWVSSEGR